MYVGLFVLNSSNCLTDHHVCGKVVECMFDSVNWSSVDWQQHKLCLHWQVKLRENLHNYCRIIVLSLVVPGVNTQSVYTRSDDSAMFIIEILIAETDLQHNIYSRTQNLQFFASVSLIGLSRDLSDKRCVGGERWIERVEVWNDRSANLKLSNALLHVFWGKGLATAGIDEDRVRKAEKAGEEETKQARKRARMVRKKLIDDDKAKEQDYEAGMF
ncbi:hypothetical protein J6590_012877 [Homalodisca vitripennis]|nr:hypothetical protein J6590_012877 [Homalodisca vitripennis]